MNNNYILILISLLFLLFCYQTYQINCLKKEHFDSASDIKDAVKAVYKADIEAIRNLSSIASSLSSGNALTLPANITIPGTLNTKGAVTFDSTLNTTGAVTFTGNSTVAGDLTIKSGNLIIGNWTINTTNSEFEIKHVKLGRVLHIAAYAGREKQFYFDDSKTGWLLDNITTNSITTNNIKIVDWTIQPVDSNANYLSFKHKNGAAGAISSTTGSLCTNGTDGRHRMCVG